MNPKSAVAGLLALIILAFSTSIIFSACSLVSVSEPSINSIDSAAREGSRPKDRSTKAQTAKHAQIIGLFSNIHGQLGKASIYTVNQQGQISNWDPKTGKSKIVFDLERKIDLVSFSQNGDFLALAENNGLEIRSLPEGKLLKTLPKHRLQTRVLSMDFDPEAKSLLIAGADARVYQWNFGAEQTSDVFFAKSETQHEKDLQAYIGHSSVVSAVLFHSVGKVFFSADWSGAIYAWQTYDSDRFSGFFDKNLFGDRFFAQQVVRVQGARQGQAGIEYLRLSPDGEFLVVAYQDGVLELWKIRGFDRVFSVQAHQGLIYDLCFDSSGKQLLTLGRDANLKLWNIEQKETTGLDKSDYALNMIKESKQLEARKAQFTDAQHVVLVMQNGTLKLQQIGAES